MHVTACLAGQKVDVEVGEDCRSLQALREAIVEELPQLCVEGFDVSVGGRALDDDEGVVSLTESACLDVVANTRGLAVLALREAGRTVREAGLLAAALEGDVSLVTLYLDAGVPIDYVDASKRYLSFRTPLHIACLRGHLALATLLLDRGSTAIDEKEYGGQTPLHLACEYEHLEMATLLLDRGSTAIDEKDKAGDTPLHVTWCTELARLLLDRGSTAIDEKEYGGLTPLHIACGRGRLEIATLLLDRGSTAIDAKDDEGQTPLHLSCDYEGLLGFWGRRLEMATLLLDRGSTAIDEKDKAGNTPLHLTRCTELARLLLDRGCSVDVEESRRGRPYTQEVQQLLSERGHDVLPDASPEKAKRRRIGEQ